MGGEPRGCGIHETEGWFGSIKAPRGVPGTVGDAGRCQSQQTPWKVLLLQSSPYKGPGASTSWSPARSFWTPGGGWGKLTHLEMEVGVLFLWFSGWPGRSSLAMIHSRKTEFKKEYYRDIPSGLVVVVGSGLVAELYPTLCNPWSSPPGSSVHGILQARILEWIAITFSRGSS